MAIKGLPPHGNIISLDSGLYIVESKSIGSTAAAKFVTVSLNLLYFNEYLTNDNGEPA